MNPSAGEETLSAAEVPEINQVTVATVTTTSTTNTQTVAGAGACYIPLFTGYAPQQALSNYSYQSSGYQQSVADYQEHPINFFIPHLSYILDFLGSKTTFHRITLPTSAKFGKQRTKIKPNFIYRNVK